MAFVQTGGAGQVRVVRISARTDLGVKSVTIEPQTLRVTEGSVIVWVNEGPDDEAKIVFDDGTRCADVSSSATLFSLESSCYVTSWVPVGGTSSLRFNESGDLDYVVETAGGQKARGKVIVYFGFPELAD
jgi:hypothetical protein